MQSEDAFLHCESVFTAASSRISIGSIFKAIQYATIQKRKATAVSSNTKKGTRYVKWEPAGANSSATYTCIRKGRVFASEEEIDTVFKEAGLHENMFFLFKNMDPNVDWNPDVPMFEATYQCGTVGTSETGAYYIKAQKKHLKQAYTAAERTCKDEMWTIYPDGTPYWVDRYAFCKQKHGVSKRKFENKKQRV